MDKSLAYPYHCRCHGLRRTIDFMIKHHHSTANRQKMVQKITHSCLRHMSPAPVKVHFLTVPAGPSPSGREAQCPCGGPVPMWRPGAHVEAQCPCGGPVPMWRPAVPMWRPSAHVEAQCPCGGPVPMWRPRAHVEAQGPCGGPVPMWRPSAHG